MTRAVALVSLFYLFASGCAIVNGVDDDAFFVTDVSIRLFRGFEPGADEATVQQLFGLPDGWATGDFYGFKYYYGNGSRTAELTELEILFSEHYERRAVRIRVHSPYPEVTVEGIGIGASSATVASVLGKPDESEIRADWGSFGGYVAGDIYFAQRNSALCFRYDSSGHVDRIDFFVIEIGE